MTEVNELKWSVVGRSGSASRILFGLVGNIEVGTVYLKGLVERAQTRRSAKYRGRLQ
jgi:hypothetical protein